MSVLQVILVALLAGFVLWRNLPGALLCVRPRLMRARRPDDGSPVADGRLFDDIEAELKPLGFARLGFHLEQAPLARPVSNYDFVQAGDRTFATAFPQGGEVMLYYLTPFEGGALVVTADFRRPGVERDGYLGGGLPGASPAELLAVHRRRVDRFVKDGKTPGADLSFDARLRVAADWRGRAGAHETRLKHVNNLMLALVALAILGSIAWRLVDPLGPRPPPAGLHPLTNSPAPRSTP